MVLLGPRNLSGIGRASDGDDGEDGPGMNVRSDSSRWTHPLAISESHNGNFCLVDMSQNMDSLRDRNDGPYEAVEKHRSLALSRLL